MKSRYYRLMQKLLALFLAAMLLVSQAGVTFAAMTCVRSGKSVPMCQECNHAQAHVSISATSCCVYSAKHLAVKDSFSQPAQPTVLIPFAGIAPHHAAETALTRANSFHLSISSLGSPSAREYCALHSTFRI